MYANVLSVSTLGGSTAVSALAFTGSSVRPMVTMALGSVAMGLVLLRMAKGSTIPVVPMASVDLGWVERYPVTSKLPRRPAVRSRRR